MIVQKHSQLTEIEQKMLYFLRFFRVATRAQLVRAAGGSEAAAEAAFRSLVAGNQLHARNVDVPLNPDAKPRAGRAARRIEFYKHADDYRREKHTLHDLYVAEAFLFCCAKYRFEHLWTEDAMREFGARGSLPDFRIAGQTFAANCEVVLQNNRGDIESKPYDWLYFTPSQRQADALRALKKARVFVLPPLVCAPATQVPRAAQSEAKSEAGLSRLERTLLAFLRTIELPVDAGVAQKFVKKHRPDVAAAFAALHRKGFIYATEIAKEPGTSRGRPGKYYSINPPKSDCIDYRLAITRSCASIVRDWPIDREVLEMLLERRT